MTKKRVLFISFRKNYSIFSLERHAILEVTSSVQIHTLMGYLHEKVNNFALLKGIEIFYVWPESIKNIENIESSISAFSPDIIAVSLMNTDFAVYLKFRNIIDTKLSKRIIWVAGGYLPTTMPYEIMKSGNFDFLITNHGEYSLLGLISYLSGSNVNIKTIPNLYWSYYGKIRSNPVKNITENIDKIKLKYQPFNIKEYVKESWQLPSSSKMKYLTTWFSRGCTFNCGFCLNRVMNKGEIIIRKPEIVIDEILEMKDKYGINYVFFADENFLLKITESKKLMDIMIKKNLRNDVRFTFMTNINSVLSDDEILPMLKEAGCEEIQYGVESGSTDILSLMRKTNKVENCYTAFDKTSKNGIMTQAMMTLGYDGETLRSLEETRKFILELKPDRMSLFFVVPFMKTSVGEKMINSTNLKIPIHFFDSDIPVLSIESLENDIEKYRIKTDYFIDPMMKKTFSDNHFKLKNSQLYLLKFRDELMYNYYTSNNFINKQKEIFERRVKIFKEDPKKLFESAKHWFTILEKSIGWKTYAKTVLQTIKEGIK